jgi:hypothetical protein
MNRIYQGRGISIFRVADGKIEEEWTEYSQTGPVCLLDCDVQRRSKKKCDSLYATSALGM